MNQDHYTYRAAMRIDPIAAEFWQEHRVPRAGARLAEIAEIIDEEARTVDTVAGWRDAYDRKVLGLLIAVENGATPERIREAAREVKELRPSGHTYA